jgi:hypothetical protein
MMVYNHHRFAAGDRSDPVTAAGLDEPASAAFPICGPVALGWVPDDLVSWHQARYRARAPTTAPSRAIVLRRGRIIITPPPRTRVRACLKT